MDRERALEVMKWVGERSKEELKKMEDKDGG